MIETGRHSRPAIPRAERYCPHCPDTVECEQHFLTQCTEYNRTDLLTKFTNTCPQFAQLENKEKFIFMLSQENEELTKFLAQSVHKWMRQRGDFNQQEVIQYIVIFSNETL